MYHIRQPVPLTPQVTFMWEQLCLGDAAASYFFNRTGTVLPDTPEAEACNGAFSRVPSGKASPHFVSNMNRFGELGGYDAIIERIENEDPRISLKELYLFTRLLMLAKWCYTRKFRVPYFKRLRNAVYKRLEALTDEELRCTTVAAAAEMIKRGRGDDPMMQVHESTTTTLEERKEK